MAVVFVSGACLVVLLAWLLVYQRKTIKLIRKNQAEWNRIKRSTPKECQFEAWCNYTDILWSKRDPVVGACFPRY